MTPEPSNEYQKLVEAEVDKIIAAAQGYLLNIKIDLETGLQKHQIQKNIDRARAALSALKLPHAGDDGQVAQSAYEAAVKGRQDFRQAYRELLPVQRAAQALSDYWRSPGSRYTEDEFLDLVNAVDVAVTGGGPTTSEMRAAIALRRTTPPAGVSDNG